VQRHARLSENGDAQDRKKTEVDYSVTLCLIFFLLANGMSTFTVGGKVTTLHGELTKVRQELENRQSERTRIAWVSF